MLAFINDIYETGVLGLLLSFVESFLMTFLVYWFIRGLLPNRVNIYALIAISFVFAVWFSMRVPTLVGTLYHLLMNVFINMLTWFILAFLFKGHFWKRVMVWWYFEIVKMMCQTLSFVPFLGYRIWRGNSGEWLETTAYVASHAVLKLLYLVIFLSLFLLLGSLSQKIWRRLLLQKFQPFYLLFLVLPLGLKYSLSQVVPPNMGDVFFALLTFFVDNMVTAQRMFSLFGITACLVADIAILYYVFSHEKRAAIEAELQASKLTMELEQARFKDIEQKSEELARVRHDLNNQLMSVIQLVRAGESATAREMVDALAGEINQSIGE